MTKEAALKAFFKRFEGEQVRQGVGGEETVTWRSFPDTAVKAGTPLPYLSYSFAIDSFPESASGTVQLWDYSSQESPINAKAREIFDAIGRGGVLLQCDGGAIWLKRGTPWCNHTTGEDDTSMKVWQINITVEYLTTD